MEADRMAPMAREPRHIARHFVRHREALQRALSSTDATSQLVSAIKFLETARQTESPTALESCRASLEAAALALCSAPDVDEWIGFRGCYQIVARAFIATVEPNRLTGAPVETLISVRNIHDGQRTQFRIDDGRLLVDPTHAQPAEQDQLQPYVKWLTSFLRGQRTPVGRKPGSGKVPRTERERIVRDAAKDRRQGVHWEGVSGRSGFGRATILRWADDLNLRHLFD